MIKRADLRASISEAERFLERARALLAAPEWSQWGAPPGPLHASVKRAAVDVGKAVAALTRAAVDVNRN